MSQGDSSQKKQDKWPTAVFSTASHGEMKTKTVWLGCHFAPFGIGITKMTKAGECGDLCFLLADGDVS